MKKLNKFLCFLALGTLFCTSISSHSVYAEVSNDIVITETSTPCDDYWYPGKSESKTLSILNNMDKNIFISRLYFSNNNDGSLSINSNDIKELSENCNVTLLENNNKLLSTKLCNLLDKDGVPLDKNFYLNSNTSKDITLLIDFDPEMNNDAQGLELYLSLAINYEENIEAVSPDNSNNSNTSNTTSSNNSLPQTGVDTDKYLIALAIGLFITVCGLALKEKSSIKKGGTYDE